MPKSICVHRFIPYPLSISKNSFQKRPNRFFSTVSHRLISRWRNTQGNSSSTICLSSSDTAVVEETSQSEDVLFKETFHVQRIEKAEGKIYVGLKQGKENNWELSVGCSIPGKWILHWGVSYVGDTGSEWDQPPEDMRPPGSIAIKDYAIETPLKKLSEGDFGDTINLNLENSVAALNFVLKIPLTNRMKRRNVAGEQRSDPHQTSLASFHVAQPAKTSNYIYISKTRGNLKNL